VSKPTESTNGRNGSDQALAAATGLCTLLFALTLGLAILGVPAEWSRHHAVLVWGSTVALGLLVIGLGIATARRGGRLPPPVPIQSVRTGDGTGDVTVAAAGATVDRSRHVHDVGRDAAIAEPGGVVNIYNAAPEPAPAARAGQLVVGELPGVPPAFVEREELDRLAAIFTGGGGVAAVSALSGTRGAGKTQIAAAYARRAVEENVELVAWVSAATPDSLLSGLADIARAVGVEDPDGDSAASAARLRD
jgi:hypothetical protein